MSSFTSERRPERRQVFGADPIRPGDLGQRRLRLAKRRPMAETPGGLKIVTVVAVLLVIEIDDLLHAELLPIGLGQHRMRREGETLAPQEQVAGHVAGGLQVFLQEGRRHRQRFARVVEAGRIGRIDGEFARRPEIDAGEITNRVIVLHVAQPAGEHDAGVAGIPADFVFPHRVEPAHGGSPLGRGRMLLRFLGRHLAGLKSFKQQAPALAILHQRTHRVVGAQIHLRLRVVVAVTGDAVGFEKRLDRPVELARKVRATRHRPAREAGRQAEGSAQKEAYRFLHRGMGQRGKLPRGNSRGQG